MTRPQRFPSTGSTWRCRFRGWSFGSLNQCASCRDARRSADPGSAYISGLGVEGAGMRLVYRRGWRLAYQLDATTAPRNRHMITARNARPRRHRKARRRSHAEVLGVAGASRPSPQATGCASRSGGDQSNPGLAGRASSGRRQMKPRRGGRTTSSTLLTIRNDGQDGRDPTALPKRAARDLVGRACACGRQVPVRMAPLSGRDLRGAAPRNRHRHSDRSSFEGTYAVRAATAPHETTVDARPGRPPDDTPKPWRTRSR